MMTRFTEITPKELQRLQGNSSYKSAWNALCAIKRALQLESVLVLHLAVHWKCDEAEILAFFK
jgi:hypothetical protein